MTSQHTQVADRMRDAHTAGLAGRVALVTGGSGGIGRALVRRLAAEGTAVAVAYSAHGAAAEKTAAQAAEDGVQAMAVGADLRRPQAPAELVNAVERALGPVDVLIANAGTGRTRSWEAVSSADFDEATAVNLRAPLLLAQRTLPGMQAGIVRAGLDPDDVILALAGLWEIDPATDWKARARTLYDLVFTRLKA